MKKVATIALLALLLFNFIGYKLLFFALEKNADSTIAATIDKNNYNDADLITLTVPLSMPYIQDSKNFERKDGEITLNGKVYHYVKQKISQGNLILLCLPDEQKTQLLNAKSNYCKMTNEFQDNNTSQKSGDNGHVIKFSTSDYEEIQNTTFNTGIFLQEVVSYPHESLFALLKGEGTMPEQPPEA
ncbi:MAG: hypothetical protein JST21_09070 [Bacteroidetes bacterium]|nr:hypothetical protein [Bacteroidota bacterium]